jgi:diguanylate cyclase (GGDEF)-like protein
MEVHLALTLALVQLGLFALCWLLVAVLMPGERRPALLFLASIASDALTAWLQVSQAGSLRPGGQRLMSLGLLSATLVSAGAEAFVPGGCGMRGPGWPCWPAGTAAAWWPLPQALSEVGPLAVYQGSFLLLLGLPLLWLRAPCGRSSAATVAAPAALRPDGPGGAGLPGAPGTGPGRSHPQLRRAQRPRRLLAHPFAISSGLFHISWLGMMLGRQVVRAHSATHRQPDRRAAPRRLRDRMRGMLALARRLGQPATLVFLDIDHFKRINDLGGHAAGDQVLRQLGRLLQDTLRSTDRCGRWGGEEFVILLPGLDRAHAEATLQRLTQTLARAAIPVPEGCAALTVSIGYAVWMPGSETGPSS